MKKNILCIIGSAKGIYGDHSTTILGLEAVGNRFLTAKQQLKELSEITQTLATFCDVKDLEDMLKNLKSLIKLFSYRRQATLEATIKNLEEKVKPTCTCT